MILILADNRVPSAQDTVQQNVDIMNTLKENLQRAQNQQKLYADQRITKRVFEVNDMVYLRLHSYQGKWCRKAETKILWALPDCEEDWGSCI